MDHDAAELDQEMIKMFESENEQDIGDDDPHKRNDLDVQMARMFEQELM